MGKDHPLYHSNVETDEHLSSETFNSITLKMGWNGGAERSVVNNSIRLPDLKARQRVITLTEIFCVCHVIFISLFARPFILLWICKK